MRGGEGERVNLCTPKNAPYNRAIEQCKKSAIADKLCVGAFGPVASAMCHAFLKSGREGAMAESKLIYSWQVCAC